MPRNPNIILGLSTGHGDSAAALIINGTLVAAVEEERFTRIKHYAMFPTEAVRYCLQHAGIAPSQIDAVAIARKPRAQFARKLGVLWRFPEVIRGRKEIKTQRDRSVHQSLADLGIKAKLFQFEHHLSHLMTARLMSPKDDLALLSFDGLGDFVSAAIGKPTPHGVEIIDRVYFPHSLGFFYTAMTQYLGFQHFGDEFKVMGLSSYGKPVYVDALKELVRESTDKFGFEINLEAFPVALLAKCFFVEKNQPYINPFFNANLIRQIVGVNQRKPKDPLTEVHWNLAKSIQVRFEQVANHLLKQLHERVPVSSLALSGGCAHNSVWVGTIPDHSPFKEVHVFPASNDAGICVGAAALAAGRTVHAEGDNWGLLGPAPEELRSVPENAGIHMSTYSNEAKLIESIVDELCAKKIVGLCHGRLEYGPRALGSRSILVDPRSQEMKDILNARIKHREKFRPFAASVLWDYQEDWFESPFYSPYMEAVFPVKKPEKIPAVVHVDGTCRIQSVTKEAQPFYWKLIEAFRKRTGVPMLLNTSFNDCEPIVCSADDAMRCFSTTEMDCLVIGNTVYTKTKDQIALSA